MDDEVVLGALDFHLQAPLPLSACHHVLATTAASNPVAAAPVSQAASCCSLAPGLRHSGQNSNRTRCPHPCAGQGKLRSPQPAGCQVKTVRLCSLGWNSPDSLLQPRARLQRNREQRWRSSGLRGVPPPSLASKSMQPAARELSRRAPPASLVSAPWGPWSSTARETGTCSQVALPVTSCNRCQKPLCFIYEADLTFCATATAP